MWKLHAHATLFNLCFGSKRLSKKTSQKQPALVKTYGTKELTATGITVLQHLSSCSFLIAKGILFLTIMLSFVWCVAAEMKKQLSAFHFQILQCTFPLL